MTRILIILPAAKCAAANDWLVSHVTRDAANTFSPNLSRSGSPRSPRTHAAMSWVLPSAQAALVATEFRHPRWGADVAFAPVLGLPVDDQIRPREHRAKLRLRKIDPKPQNRRINA
jgi:hypothetical protein